MPTIEELAIEVANQLLKDHKDFSVEGFSEYMNGYFNGAIEGYKKGCEYKFSESEGFLLPDDTEYKVNEVVLALYEEDFDTDYWRECRVTNIYAKWLDQKQLWEFAYYLEPIDDITDSFRTSPENIKKI